METTDRSEYEEGQGLSRRSVLRGSVVVGGALAWSAPVVQSLTRPAFAAGSLPEMCGRFTGGGQLESAGSGGPHDGFNFSTGLELHCNPDDPRQNISLTFESCTGVQYTFHLEDVTAASCSFTGDPTPPDAPINTINITGPGRLTPGDIPATLTAPLLRSDT